MQASGTPPKGSPGIGALCIAAGLIPIAIALGWVPDDGRPQAPMSVFWLCGIVFVIAGLMAWFGQDSRYNSLGAAVICTCFGIAGAWVSLWAPADGMSGGIPFIPDDVNVAIGRTVFGLGALCSFAIAVYALRMFSRSQKHPNHGASDHA